MMYIHKNTRKLPNIMDHVVAVVERENLYEMKVLAIIASHLTTTATEGKVSDTTFHALC